MTVDERVEWEANWFAVGFLMPETKFREDWAALHGDIFAMAEKYGVSYAHAQMRAKGLGLLKKERGDDQSQV